MPHALALVITSAIDATLPIARASAPLISLGAISAWTAALCVGVSRRVQSRRAVMAPSVRAMLVAASGVPVWAAAAWLHPLTALQVSGAAVALVFSWDVAGVLERLVMTKR